jgi:hypothetical protein
MGNRHEEWRDVVGFEGLYAVSNLGNVKRVARWVNVGRGGQRQLPEHRMKSQEMGAWVFFTFRRRGKIVQRAATRLLRDAFPELYDVDALV